MKEVHRDQDELWRLLETDEGKLVLEVVLAGIGWNELRIPLSDVETREYRDEGLSYLRRMVHNVLNDPDGFIDRATS